MQHREKNKEKNVNSAAVTETRFLTTEMNTKNEIKKEHHMALLALLSNHTTQRHTPTQATTHSLYVALHALGRGQALPEQLLIPRTLHRQPY